MAKERAKGNGRRTKNKVVTPSGKEYIYDRDEDDKRKARVEGKEAINDINTKALEKGIEPLKRTDQESKKRIGDKVDELKKVEKAKTRELKKVGAELKKGKTSLNENKLELTRDELKEMGIELKSEIKFGTYAKLSDEQKALFDKEFSSALMGKAIKLLNSCFDEDKIEKASLKDSAIAMSILIDKMKLLDGKPEKTVEIKHTLTSLIHKNSESKMTDMNFDDVIDAEVVEDNENEDEES